MTMTPRNMTTTEFLALAASNRSSAPALLIRVYDFTARKWARTNDATIIAEATKAAAPQMSVGMSSGDRLFIGDIDGKRVMVEIW